MEQKHGGGLGITAVMQESVDYSSYYLKAKAKRDRAQVQKEREDREFFAKLRRDQARMDREYAPKAEKAWENLQWGTRKRPVSDTQWEEIKRRAGAPSMGLEMTTTRAEAEAEATAPIDQGILGLGLLGAVRKLVWEEIEKSEKKREAAKNLNRATIF